eukprot:gene9517-1751_t
MESKNNKIGVALALSSSAFIGLSFIVKKKGLIRSRASGSSAGDGGFSYLREWLWWAGLLTMVIGEAANFIAYAFAPAILVTPLGALSVIISAILASMFLKERLNILGKVGCGLCIVGSTIIVVNAPQEQDVKSVSVIAHMMFQNAFSPKYGKRYIFVNIAICSVIGSLSVIAVKGLGIALKLTFEGSNQLGKGSTWGFVFMVAACVMTQMNYLNKALDTFNTALVTPIYYVLFTTSTIIASALLFHGWSNKVQDFDATLVTCFCGFLVICSGIFLLHHSREERDGERPFVDDPLRVSDTYLVEFKSNGRNFCTDRLKV